MSGVDDWVHMPEAVSYVQEAANGLDEASALPLAVEVIKRMLYKGLIRVGDVGDDGFVPWSGSLSAIEERLDQEMARVTHFPLRFGEVCWVQNTPSGDQRGNELLADPQLSGPRGSDRQR